MSAMGIPPQVLKILTVAGWFLAGYLLGSIPIAWLLTRWVTGEDLRQLGSGNVGVMNTAISTARWAGLLVFMTELAKGVLAVAVPKAYDSGELIVGLTVVAVVIGIRWPVWLGFKGGRANTAGMAAVLLISWQAMVSLTVLWILARWLTRNSFKATRITFVLMPFILGVITRSWWFTLTALALLIIYLTMQRPDSDDHLLLKERWESLWDFLTSPPRKG